MLEALIIYVRNLNFVKLRGNQFLKNIFETTLHCTVSTVGEMHETILSVNYWRGSRTPVACKTKLLVSIVCNFQLLTIATKNYIFTKNSIIDAAAPKLYFILICFCFKCFLHNVMFIHFRSIQKILSNSYKLRKAIELH